MKEVIKNYSVLLLLTTTSCNGLHKPTGCSFMNKTQSQTESSKAGDLPRNGQTCKELLEIGEAAYEAICMVYDPNKDYRKFNYNSYERMKSLFYKYTNKKCNAHAMYNYNALFSALYNKFSLLQDYFRETPCYEHYPARVDFLYAFIFYLIRKKYVTLYRLQQAVKQAIDKNAPELLEALCKNGIDLNFTYNEDGQAEEVQSDTAASIFYWALKLRGEGAIVNIILAYHPKLLNAKVFKKQETCLHRAAGEGNIAMVKLLLAKGAKVNPSNKKGYTPLDKSIAGDHLEVFKVLLAHNGRIRDAHKMSMVSAAVKCGGEGLKILAYLVSKDPGCVTMQDPDKVGDTPVHWATREHNLDGLQILSQCCIGWRDVKNKKGKEPLAVAHPDLVLKIEAFSQIKRFWLPLLGGQSRNDLCGICQESDRLYRTKCNHCFHQGCINRLVRSNIIEYIAYNNWRDCKDWRRLGHRCPCCRKRL